MRTTLAELATLVSMPFILSIASFMSCAPWSAATAICSVFSRTTSAFLVMASISLTAESTCCFAVSTLFICLSMPPATSMIVWATWVAASAACWEVAVSSSLDAATCSAPCEIFSTSFLTASTMRLLESPNAVNSLLPSRLTLWVRSPWAIIPDTRFSSSSALSMERIRRNAEMSVMTRATAAALMAIFSDRSIFSSIRSVPIFSPSSFVFSIFWACSLTARNDWRPGPM